MAQFQDYLIAVKTANNANANMDGITPYATLAGFFGASTKYALNASSAIALGSPITTSTGTVLVPTTQAYANKFEVNQWDVFKIRTNNVGTVLQIRLEKGGTDAWKPDRVVVIPYKADGTTLDIEQHRTFTINRWFDSADFDNLSDLTIDSDQVLDSPTWTQNQVIKTAKTMVMRYDNTAGSTTVRTTMTCHYSLVQGAAIEKNKTSSTTTSVGVSATTSFEAGGGILGEPKVTATVTTDFNRQVTESCENKCGTSTTSTLEQSQEIPIEVPANAAVTLIVQVYQRVLKHNVSYGGYQVPITVYDPTAEVQFKLYTGILDNATANLRSQELATLAGAILS
jgi:hypothetical protein